MPKNVTGQGNSANTPVKQEALEYFMGIHTEIVRLIVEKYKHNHWDIDQKYYYIDTNAGTGLNTDGTDGSIKIACRAIRERFPEACIYGIEKNHLAVLALQTNTVVLMEQYPGGTLNILSGDNQKELIVGMIRRPSQRGRQYGLVYSDPNGVNDFPLTALQGFFRHYDTQKLDVLINIGANMIKRCRGAGLDKFVLDTIIERIDKDYWYVRDHVGRDQWTFLFGTNWDKWPALRIRVNGVPLRVTSGNLQSLGMYRLYPDPMPQAMRIWEEITLTHREVLKKSLVPLIAPIANTSDILSFWKSEPTS